MTKTTKLHLAESAGFATTFFAGSVAGDPSQWVGFLGFLGFLVLAALAAAAFGTVADMIRQ